MSEYQYYEFRAVDRPLAAREQAELRGLSTRAEISAYRFSNVYHWGHFKGSPDEMMERYFDAHLYVTNWGIRRLMLRLPLQRFEPRRAHPYLVRNGASLRTHGDKVILSFEVEEQWPEQVQGEPWLASLLPLRQELLSGDMRGLYLAWLACASAGQLGDEVEEPPVPAGLRTLSAALVALTDFLLISPELLEVAARASPEFEADAPSQELEAWVQALPASEKDAFLLRFIDRSAPSPGLELLQRFHATQACGTAQAPAPRRTVGALLRAAESLQEELEQRERERQVAARERHLEELAAREPAAWERVEQLFATRRPTDHATGVRLLVDLREVAKRRGTEAEFHRKLSLLRERNAKRAGLMARMDKEGLSAP